MINILRNITVSALLTFILTSVGSSQYFREGIYRDKLGRKIHMRTHVDSSSGKVTKKIKLKVNLFNYGVDTTLMNEQRIAECVKKIVDEYAGAIGVTSGELDYYYLNYGKDSSFQLAYKQVFNHIPVFGAAVNIFSVGRKGKWIRRVEADIFPGIHCDVVPRLSADSAICTSKNEFSDNNIDFGEPVLTILPKVQDSVRVDYLAWLVPTNRRIGCTAYFINAVEGGIISRITVVEASNQKK